MIFGAKKWKYYTAVWSQFEGRWKWEGRPNQDYTHGELLGELGKEGWELVAVAPYAEDSKIMAHEYIFKKKA